MKKLNFIIIMIIFFAINNYSFSQMYERQFGPAPERIEKYKKLRLIEELNLPEEEAIKFNRLYNAHLDTLKSIRRMLDEYRKGMEKHLEAARLYQQKSKEYENYLKDLRKTLKDFEDWQKKFYDEQKKFNDKLKQLLTDEQIAKYYLFEKKFYEELHDALRKMREDMPKRRKR